ncbi:acyl-CoA dehydrogenase family protein [Acidilobus sp. 7A]|uniref:acyl-CoA dehydrogenase family protein n=1 Tax=Acidilobus sp. 7A TaxID=1577685 RepID=UPI000764E64E|nr:acyl-CoA dehydrogenase family protein [Acidilobus sp. 7A]AMD30150.1 acyl-CoA dehydrogenase [Acidilobus sp. 7A]
MASESLELLRSSVREFAEKVIRPVARDIDRDNAVPQDVVKQVADMGYFALRVPQDYGGPGLSTLESVIVVEELARASGAVAIMATVSGTMVAYPLVHYAGEGLRRRYLERLARGSIGAFALSEPCCGTDAAAITTRAVKEGDEYVISGRKTWITNSPYADFFLVAARTGRPEDRHRGVSIFVVDRGPCVEVSKLDMMGYRGSGTSEVLFRDCRVPESNMVGQLNGGFKIVMDALNEGRVVTAATALGLAEAAFEDSLAYAKQRESMGVPIAEHQMVQYMLAEMKVRVEAIRQLIYEAARRVDAGDPDYPMWSSMAKLAAASWGVDVARMAVQVEGGFGYSRESLVERVYRDVKMVEIGDGTNEVQRLVIARSLLGRVRGVRAG